MHDKPGFHRREASMSVQTDVAQWDVTQERWLQILALYFWGDHLLFSF